MCWRASSFEGLPVVLEAAHPRALDHEGAEGGVGPIAECGEAHHVAVCACGAPGRAARRGCARPRRRPAHRARAGARHHARQRPCTPPAGPVPWGRARGESPYRLRASWKPRQRGRPPRAASARPGQRAWAGPPPGAAGAGASLRPASPPAAGARAGTPGRSERGTPRRAGSEASTPTARVMAATRKLFSDMTLLHRDWRRPQSSVTMMPTPVA